MWVKSETLMGKICLSDLSKKVIRGIKKCIIAANMMSYIMESSVGCK